MHLSKLENPQIHQSVKKNKSLRMKFSYNVLFLVWILFCEKKRNRKWQILFDWNYYLNWKKSLFYNLGVLFNFLRFFMSFFAILVTDVAERNDRCLPCIWSLLPCAMGLSGATWPHPVDFPDVKWTTIRNIRWV